MDKLRWNRPLVICLGLVVVSVLLIKNGIKSESKKWYGVLFASDYFPPLNGFPSTTDADERLLICQKLGEAYPFTKSKRYALDMNYYCASGSLHTVVIIYEIIDPIEQQKIVKAAHAIRTRFNTRDFSIEFYAHQTGATPRNQFIWKIRID